MEAIFIVFFIRLFIRLLIGLILLSVGVSKLIHPRLFQRAIQDYQLIPSNLETKISLSLALAFGIPLTEILGGLGLIIGFFLAYSVVLILVLFGLFTGAILINLARGRSDLSCHCSGILGDHRISWWLIVRNGLFIGGLLSLLITPSDTFTIDKIVHSPLAFTNVLVSVVLPAALLVGVVLAAIVLVNYARILWRA